MTPNVLFEQLLIVALVLICLLMHVWGPSSRSPACQRPFKPAKPRRKRAKDPKPFTGYIPKPLCEACEQRLDARLRACLRIPSCPTCDPSRPLIFSLATASCSPYHDGRVPIRKRQYHPRPSEKRAPYAVLASVCVLALSV
jgi:hypothetical protein